MTPDGMVVRSEPTCLAYRSHACCAVKAGAADGGAGANVSPSFALIVTVGCIAAVVAAQAGACWGRLARKPAARTPRTSAVPIMIRVR